MIRLFHASDLHLGRLRKAKQPLLHQALRTNLTLMFERAIEEKVDIILLAGDLLDDGSSEPREELFLLDLFSQTSEKGIDIFVCTGNHDSTLHAPLWREHVELFDTPEVKIIDKERYRVVSQGYLHTIDSQEGITFPTFFDGKPTIGLLHSQVYSGNIPYGAPYHPTRLQDLQELQYNYIALGHEHAFRLVSQRPQIVYSGALSPLHFFDASSKGYVDLTLGQEPIFHASSGILFEERILMLESEAQTASKIYPHIFHLLHEEPKLFLLLTLEGKMAFREKEAVVRLLNNLPIGRIAMRDHLQVLEDTPSLPDEIYETLRTFTPAFSSSVYHSAPELKEFYTKNPEWFWRILEEALLEADV